MAKTKKDEDTQEDESPLELIYWMLEISGMMVRPGTKYPRLVRFHSWFQCINLVFFGISVFLHLTIGDAKFKEKSESAQFLVSTLHIGAKHFNIFLRQKSAAKFFSVIEDMWQEAKKDKSNLIIFRETRKRSYRTVHIVLPACIGLIPLVIIMSIITNKYLVNEGRRLPIETWIPFDGQKYFWSAAIYQSFLVHSPILSFSVSVALVQLISSQVTTQMRVLQNMMVKRDEDKNGHLKSYLLHQNILKLVRDMNSFFGGQYTFEIGLSSLQVAIRSYRCIRGISEGDAMVVAYLFLFVLTLVAPYSICSSGTAILHQADKIHETAYQNSWYSEKRSTLNDLLLLQLMATKPVNLNFKYFLTFSLEQFTTIIQRMFSYLTMIMYFDRYLHEE